MSLKYISYKIFTCSYTFKIILKLWDDILKFNNKLFEYHNIRIKQLVQVF
jgi:hypothetical protein